jgi:hypothetical protein
VVASASKVEDAFISILDVSNPAAMSQIGGKPLAVNPASVTDFNRAGTVKSIGVAKGLATIPASATSPPLGYVSVTEVGIFALDLTKSIDPWDPVLNRRRAPDPSKRQMEGFYAGDYGDVVAVGGNRLVALNNNYGQSSSLDVFDADLSLVSSVPLNDAGRRLAFKAGVASDRDGDGVVRPGEYRDLLFVGGVDGITIFDATDTQALQLLGNVPMPGIIRELAPLSTGKTLLAGGYYSRNVADGDALYMVDVSNVERSGLIDRPPTDGRDDRILFTARYTEIGAVRADPDRGFAYVGGPHRVLDIWGMSLASEKYKDKLELRPQLIPLPTLPATEQLSVWLTPGGSAAARSTDVATDTATQYDWLGGSSDHTSGLTPGMAGLPDVSVLLNQLITALSERAGATIPVLIIPADKIAVVGGVLQVSAPGIQVIRARNGAIKSNFALVLAGFKLDSISLEPVPELNIAGTLISKAFGAENPPFVLFPGSSPYNAFAKVGQLELTDMTFKYLGRGKLSSAALYDFIRPFLKGGLSLLVQRFTGLGARGAELAAGVVLTSIQRLVGVGFAQLLEDVKSDDLNVATITSRPTNLFQGFVEAQNPGLTAVHGTLDLGKFGKASDSVFVFSAPRLDVAMIEPNRSVISQCAEPALVRTDGVFYLGSGSVTLDLEPGETNVLKALDQVLPGGVASWSLISPSVVDRIAQAFGVPVRFFGSIELGSDGNSLVARDWILKLPMPNIPSAGPWVLAWTQPYSLDYTLTNPVQVTPGARSLFKQAFKPASAAVRRGQSFVSSKVKINLVGEKLSPPASIVIDCGSPSLDLYPPIVPSVTCSGSRALTLIFDPVDGTAPLDVADNAGVVWEWVDPSIPASSEIGNTLDLLRESLGVALGLPGPVPVAAVTVSHGVLSISGCGVNLVRAHFAGLDSGYTLVIAGFKLDSIDLVPTSSLTASAVTLSDLAALALPGSRNAPLFLTAPGVPYVAGTPFVGDKGAVSVANVRFAYLGGPGRVDIGTFMNALRPALDRVLTVLGWDDTDGAFEMADVLKRLTDNQPGFLVNSLVSYQATDDAVAIEPGTPAGRVTSQHEGLTFVKGTLDLGPLGTADDAVLTWVLPHLTKATVRPHSSVIACTSDPLRGPLVRTFAEASVTPTSMLAVSLLAADTDTALSKFVPGGYSPGQSSVNLVLRTGGVNFNLEFSLASFVPACSTTGDSTSCGLTLGDARVGFDVPTQAPGVQLTYQVANPGVADVQPIEGAIFDARILRHASSQASTTFSADVAISGMGAATDPNAEIFVECCSTAGPVCLFKFVTTGTDHFYYAGDPVGFRVVALNATTADQTIAISDDLLANGAVVDAKVTMVTVPAASVVTMPYTAVAPVMEGVLANHVYLAPEACALGSPRCPWVWVVPPPQPGVMPRVTINEVVTEPVTDWNGDGVVNAADQWVEVSLYGPIGQLDTWPLRLRFTNAANVTVTVPIGSAFPGARNYFDYRGLLVLQNPGGMAPGTKLELLDPGGLVLDEVTVTGTVTGPADEAFARVPHLADHDLPGDFQRRPATRGAFNPMR